MAGSSSVSVVGKSFWPDVTLIAWSALVIEVFFALVALTQCRQIVSDWKQAGADLVIFAPICVYCARSA